MDKAYIELRSIEMHQEMVQHSREVYDFWVNNILWTWQWWVGVCLTVIPWVVWLLLRKKDSTHRVLFAVTVVAFIAVCIDVVAVSHGLWRYSYEVLPIIPAFLPWYVSLIPVFIAFLLQIRPEVNPVVKGIICGVGGSMIAEPLFEWLGFYQTVHWEHIYSFPLYFIAYVLAHFISRRQSFESLDDHV
ncbi:CBO0543 family protein [Caldalkalibacillus salinus]|uniref:CBO0543 family protein n=1 Tax=Caldalkalibacillus salinus TaxID=2803787 RepID=UPI00192242DE|nr:CBO0543 family protein [Caldalkalibacillus salinus]